MSLSGWRITFDYSLLLALPKEGYSGSQTAAKVFLTAVDHTLAARIRKRFSTS